MLERDKRSKNGEKKKSTQIYWEWKEDEEAKEKKKTHERTAIGNVKSTMAMKAVNVYMAMNLNNTESKCQSKTNNQEAN